MTIAGTFSFKNGENYINEHYPHLLIELKEIISSVNANKYKTKISKEKAMAGKMLFNRLELNKVFSNELNLRGWNKKKIFCNYSKDYYTEEYNKYSNKFSYSVKPYRKMDFIKEKLGVEVQFDKYTIMVYDVCAKMIMFHKKKFIDAGIEIVPIKIFANEMTTGISYFEQLVWDLKQRGTANIDIPVMIIGIGE